MESGDKVSANLRLDAVRDLKLKGEVLQVRKVFGRDECLIRVDEAEPIWITKDKVKKL